jgi:hypothetical protein
MEKYSEMTNFLNNIRSVQEKAMNDIRFKYIKSAVNGNKLKDALVNINSIIEMLRDDIKKITLDDIELAYNIKEGHFVYDFDTKIETYLNQLNRAIKKDKSNKKYDNDDNNYILDKINNGNTILSFVDFDVDKKAFNKIDIGGSGFPEFFKGLGLGKLVYKALVKKLKYASLNGNAERTSKEADLLISSVLKDKDLYSFSIDSFIITFWNECEYDFIIKTLKEFYKLVDFNDNIQFDDDFLQKYNLDNKKLKDLLINPILECIK